MRWLEGRARGIPVGEGVVPIVPAAAVFDLAPLGRSGARPTAAMASDACDGVPGLADPPPTTSPAPSARSDA